MRPREQLSPDASPCRPLSRHTSAHGAAIFLNSSFPVARGYHADWPPRPRLIHFLHDSEQHLSASELVITNIQRTVDASRLLDAQLIDFQSMLPFAGCCGLDSEGVGLNLGLRNAVVESHTTVSGLVMYVLRNMSVAAQRNPYVVVPFIG